VRSESGALPSRGEIRRLAARDGTTGAVVVVGRTALAARTGRIACVPLRTPALGLPSEVAVAAASAVVPGAVVAADEPFSAGLEELGDLLGSLGPLDLEALDGALRYSLDVPGPIPGRLGSLRALAP
jgi:mRNA-degrading endonuclease toxin of MazEF toxin-antitoxin module